MKKFCAIALVVFVSILPFVVWSSAEAVVVPNWLRPAPGSFRVRVDADYYVAAFDNRLRRPHTVSSFESILPLASRVALHSVLLTAEFPRISGYFSLTVEQVVGQGNWVPHLISVTNSTRRQFSLHSVAFIGSNGTPLPMTVFQNDLNRTVSVSVEARVNGVPIAHFLPNGGSFYDFIATGTLFPPTTPTLPLGSVVDFVLVVHVSGLVSVAVDMFEPIPRTLAYLEFVMEGNSTPGAFFAPPGARALFMPSSVGADIENAINPPGVTTPPNEFDPGAAPPVDVGDIDFDFEFEDLAGLWSIVMPSFIGDYFLILLGVSFPVAVVGLILRRRTSA